MVQDYLLWSKHILLRLISTLFYSLSFYSIISILKKLDSSNWSWVQKPCLYLVLVEEI